MKRNLLKGCIYLVCLFALIIGFPVFFNIYPDFRFFWTICAVLITCTQFFFLIIEKKVIHLKIALFFLLSVVMANNYYSYKTLSTVFPVLNEFTKSGLFGLGASVILLAAVCGGVYNTFHALKERHKKVVPDLRQKMVHEAAATSDTRTQMKQEIPYTNDDKSEIKQENSTDASLQPGSDSPFHLHHIIGIAAAIIVILLSASVIFYALCKNQEFLMELTTQGLPSLTFNLLFGFCVVLAAIFVLTILVFYFIQLCYTIICDMFKQRRLNIQNDSLLKCISVFLTMCCFFFYRDATMKDLFTLINGSNEVVSLLIMVLIFTVLIFVTLIVFKILKSFANADGALRTYINEIFNLVIGTIGNTIINVLKMLDSTPDLFESLLHATKNAFDILFKILFDIEEDDFEEYSEELK